MIKNIEEYFDGGTYEIFLDNGESYSIDNRLFTKTQYKIYNGYPKDDNSNLVENQKEIKTMLLEYLDNYVYKPAGVFDFVQIGTSHLKKILEIE